MKTNLPESRLVALRALGHVCHSRFVDPCVIHQCSEVLDRRGEGWAASVLGRDISRRSQLVPHRPFLKDGEEYTLVAADTAEDAFALDQLRSL